MEAILAYIPSYIQISSQIENIQQQASTLSDTLGNAVSDSINTQIITQLFDDHLYKPVGIPSFDDVHTYMPNINPTNLAIKFSVLFTEIISFTLGTLDVLINDIINNYPLFLNGLWVLFVCIVLLNYETQNLMIKRLKNNIDKMESNMKKHMNLYTTTHITNIDKFANVQNQIEELGGFQKTHKSIINALDRKMRKIQKELYNEY